MAVLKPKINSAAIDGPTGAIDRQSSDTLSPWQQDRHLPKKTNSIQLDSIQV